MVKSERGIAMAKTRTHQKDKLMNAIDHTTQTPEEFGELIGYKKLDITSRTYLV